MFESLAHRLVGGNPLRTRSIALELPESRIARDLGALQDRYPEVEMGSTPFQRDGRLGTRLVLRATEPERLIAAAGELDAIIAGLGGSGDWDLEA